MPTEAEKALAQVLSWLASIHAVYWSDERLAAYMAALEGYDTARLITACRHLARNLDRMPVPANIINAYEFAGMSEREMAVAAAGEAYRAAVQIKTVGEPGQAEALVRLQQDPVFRAAWEACGGWSNWRETKWSIFRAQFVEAYVVALKRANAIESGLLPWDGTTSNLLGEGAAADQAALRAAQQ